MNCQEATLRLPWWLNGSLEPEERREVEDHLAGCASCREALEETRLAWEVYAQHVPTAALVAYAADERPAGIDSGLLERHLEDCPQCAAELEMARASRLLTEHDEVPLLVPRQAAVPARRPSRERGWQAAALAAGLTGLVAIGGWVGSVQQLAELKRPAVLRSATQARQGDAAHGTVVQEIRAFAVRSTAPPQTALPASTGHVTFILHPHSPSTYPEHAFQVLDAGNQVHAKGANLHLNLGGYYSVDVDLKLLPPGDYAIQVYGISAAGAHQPLDRFPFTVQ